MASKDVIVEIPPDATAEKSKSNVKVSEYEVSGTADKIEYQVGGLGRQFSGMRRTTTTDTPEPTLYNDEVDTISWLGKIYTRVMNFSFVTRYALYFLPGAIILAIPLIIFATVAKSTNADRVRLFGVFVWLEILWTGLWISKLFARTLPYIVQFLCGMVSAETRKIAEFIKALELPLSLIVWSIVAWATVPVIAFFNLHDKSVSITVEDHGMWVHTVRRVFLATIPVSGVFFVEKFFIQLIAVNYHRKQFYRKIKDQKHMVRLLTDLWKTSISLFPLYCQAFEDEDYHIINTTIGGKLRATVTTGQDLVEGLTRVGNGVTSVFNNLASEVVGGRKLDPTSDEAIVIQALEKKASSKALAARLWRSLAREGASALYEQDIANVLGPDRQADAEAMFRLLDQDRNGDVSLEEMQAMVVDLEERQKSMLRSMTDVKHTVAALDRILVVGIIVPIAIIYASFFSKDFLKNLTVLTTSILSFSFAFAGTVQEFAGSCIFLFIKHPYDIGDRVDIDNTAMIVEHISLLYTVFRKVDTNKTVQIPNIVSNSSWIENVTRSNAMKEQINISISSDTSAEDIKALHHELQAFVLSTDNKRDYQPEVLVDVNAIGDFKQLELTIEYGHKSNWSNETLRLTRRANFLTELIACLRRVPIYAPGHGYAALGAYNNPTYSVAVSDEEAKAAMTNFSSEKEAKRLVNAKRSDANDGFSSNYGVGSGAEYLDRGARRNGSAVSEIYGRGQLRADVINDHRRRSSATRGIYQFE